MIVAIHARDLSLSNFASPFLRMSWLKKLSSWSSKRRNDKMMKLLIATRTEHLKTKLQVIWICCMLAYIKWNCESIEKHCITEEIKVCISRVQRCFLSFWMFTGEKNVFFLICEFYSLKGVRCSKYMVSGMFVALFLYDLKLAKVC